MNCKFGIQLLIIFGLTLVGTCGEEGSGSNVEQQARKLLRVSNFIRKRVDYRGSKISVVDMHIHTGKWDDLPPHFQDTLREEFLPFPFNLFPKPMVNAILSSYGIAAQLLGSKICHGVLLAVYAPETTGLTTNEFVRKQISKAPRKFHGMASLPVDNWVEKEEAALDELRTYLGHSEFIGVKMAHPHMGLNLSDSRYYSIYEVAGEFGVPVFIHTGLAGSQGSLTNPEATHPSFMEEAIQLYPEVNFVLGHMGHKADFEGFEDPFDACFRLANDYPNVFLEASAVGSSSNDPEGEKLLRIYQGVKDRGLINRIIYGSDGPQFPGFIKKYLEATKKALRRANYTVDEADQVFSGNFLELYGLEEKGVLY